MAADESAAPPVADSIWFDAETDQLIPIEVEPRVDDSLNRDSRWLPKPKRVKQSTPSSTTSGASAGNTGGGGTGGLFGSGLTIGNLFGWFLLVALLVGAIGLLLYVMSKAEVEFGSNGNKRKRDDSTPDEQMIERMKHLPAELRRTDVNLRTEAERLMNAGKFDQAIILLFGHQLLLLDRVGMLRLNRGKTNRKYLRETRRANSGASDRLEKTIDAFERSYFGRHAITLAEFGELWRLNGELEGVVESERGAAA